MDELYQKFVNLGVWQNKGERAPNKPLLILLFIGRLQNKFPRLAKFSEIEEPLKKLLQEFGPSRDTYHPEYPFWYLKNDRVWDITPELQVKARSQPTAAQLKNIGAKGGFTSEVYTSLTKNKGLQAKIISFLIEEHFSETLHSDILDRTNISIPIQIVTNNYKRDPHFRPSVLRAYENKCAVCGFNAFLDGISIGLEAAHIKMLKAGGPNISTNGLALCSLHHLLFDRGAFTISPSLIIHVSEKLADTSQKLTSWHGQKLTGPYSKEYIPEEEFILWHNKEIFKGPARHHLT